MPNYTVTYRATENAAPATRQIAADSFKYDDRDRLFLVKRVDGSNLTVAGFRYPIAVWDADESVASDRGRVRVIGGA